MLQYKDISFFHKEDFGHVLDSLDTLMDEISKISARPEHVILNNKEAQQLLKISSKTLQKWRDSGIIAYSKIGREIFYTLRQVLDMLEKHKHDSLS